MSYITTPNQFIAVAGNQIAYRELLLKENRNLTRQADAGGSKHCFEVADKTSDRKSHLGVQQRGLTPSNSRFSKSISKGKSAKPLVLLTHLSATMDNWDPKLLDLLAEHQHLLVFDLPGVGASTGKVPASIPQMAEQARAIIQAFGYDNINLLGLSMGGMVAQELVRQQANLVDHLILAGTAPRGGLEVDKVTGKTFRYMAKAALNLVDPKRYIFYPHDAEGKQIAQTVLGRMGQRQPENADKAMSIPGFLTQLRAIKDWGRADQDDLSYITQPTLIVNGDKDMQVPTENSHDMHKKIKGSQLIIYPHAGHGSIFQYADDFAEAVRTFLEEGN